MESDLGKSQMVDACSADEGDHIFRIFCHHLASPLDTTVYIPPLTPPAPNASLAEKPKPGKFPGCFLRSIPETLNVSKELGNKIEISYFQTTSIAKLLGQNMQCTLCTTTQCKRTFQTILTKWPPQKSHNLPSSRKHSIIRNIGFEQRASLWE